MKKLNWKSLIADFIIMIVGSFFYAVAIDVFTAPNNIAPGGVTGIATLLNYLSTDVWHLPFEIPIGVATLAMNVPLLIMAWFMVGRPLVLRTLVGLAFSSIAIDVMEPLVAPMVKALQGDGHQMMLVCIFGGVLLGLGVGLILARGGTTGGSEITARVLEKKFPHIPVGKLILIIDACVITASGIVYRDLLSPMYAVVLVFISSLVIDWVVYGGRQGKLAMILSKKQPEVTAAIMEQVKRGVTLLKSQGGYSGADQNTMLVAVRREEVFRLRQLVFEIDPDAFFMLLSTDEVRGLGFMNPHQE